MLNSTCWQHQLSPSLYVDEVSRVWVWLTGRSSRVGADQERLVRWVARLEFEARGGPAVVLQALQEGEVIDGYGSNLVRGAKDLVVLN